MYHALCQSLGDPIAFHPPSYPGRLVHVEGAMVSAQLSPVGQGTPASSCWGHCDWQLSAGSSPGITLTRWTEVPGPRSQVSHSHDRVQSWPGALGGTAQQGHPTPGN